MMTKDELNRAQKLFVKYYLESGNKAGAYRKAYPSCKSAGAAAAAATRLLKNVNVLAYRDKLLTRAQHNRPNEIAKVEDVLTFLSATMRGDVPDRYGLDASLSDRLKAAELMGKRYGLFRDKLEVKATNFADILKKARERASKHDG